MPQLYGWLIAILILGVQFFLARRTSVFWGAVLPVMYLIYIYGWLFERYGEGNTVSLVLAAFGGVVILLSIWINGRESLKRKRRKELEKINLQDIY